MATSVIDVETELSDLYRIQRERVSKDMEIEKQMPCCLPSLTKGLRLLYDILRSIHEVQPDSVGEEW